ncbi:hypothetical protein K504DRAFT_380358, partial [Pleomassaria siparia CBS 279.74]
LARWVTKSGIDFIREPGGVTHRAGYVVNQTFFNILFVKTVVRDNMHCGSDYSMIVTVLPSQTPLDQYHYRVKADDLLKFAGLVEMHQVSNPNNITNKH